MDAQDSQHLPHGHRQEMEAGQEGAAGVRAELLLSVMTGTEQWGSPRPLTSSHGCSRGKSRAHRALFPRSLLWGKRAQPEDPDPAASPLNTQVRHENPTEEIARMGLPGEDRYLPFSRVAWGVFVHGEPAAPSSDT